MNKTTVPLKALGLAVALCSFTFFAGAPAASAEGSNLAVAGLDPVLLTEGVEKPGLEKLARDHGPFRYRFASEATRERFEAEPERYEIQLDGACAAMPSARANPSLFTVHEGRIYAFGTEGCRTEFLASPAFYLEEPQERRKVAVLVYEGVELLDFAGPGEVFAAAAHGRGFDVFTVGLSREPVTSQGFVEVTPQYAFADSPEPDVLVVPGGGVRAVLANEKAMAWVREVSRDAVVLSVCNGAFVLAEAGLLEGKEATTHHGSLARLREVAPNTTVHAGRRFVDNGRVITAAGVSAGIDASLHLVARLLGEGVARGTATYMEYAWREAEDGLQVASSDGR